MGSGWDERLVNLLIYTNLHTRRGVKSRPKTGGQVWPEASEESPARFRNKG